MRGINLITIRSWWESGAGDMKSGTFNIALYLRYLEIRNNLIVK